MVFHQCAALIVFHFLIRTCIVCSVTDSKSMQVLSDEQRTMIFLRRGIWVPKGVRCCSNHLYKGHLLYEAQQSVKQSKADDILLNTDDVVELINDFRLALKHAGSSDFDDPGALDNETYKTITRLDQGTLFNYCQCFSVCLF